MPRRPLDWVFLLIALAFVGTGGLHLWRALDPEAATSSPERHATFVVINLVAAAGLVVRPRWFWAAFAVLVVQQLHSHGWRAYHSDAGMGAVDVAVVLAMPVILALLMVDARRPAPDVAT